MYHPLQGFLRLGLAILAFLHWKGWVKLQGQKKCLNSRLIEKSVSRTALDAATKRYQANPKKGTLKKDYLV